MPLEVLPENTRTILEENKKLTEKFGVPVSVMRDPDIYIIINELIKISKFLKCDNALERLNELRDINKLQDLTTAKYMTLSQRELDKLQRGVSSTLGNSLTNLSDMIDRGELDI